MHLIYAIQPVCQWPCVEAMRVLYALAILMVQCHAVYAKELFLRRATQGMRYWTARWCGISRTRSARKQSEWRKNTATNIIIITQFGILLLCFGHRHTYWYLSKCYLLYEFTGRKALLLEASELDYSGEDLAHFENLVVVVLARTGAARALIQKMPQLVLLLIK